MIGSLRKFGVEVGKALVGPKGPRLVDEPENPDPIIRRTHRELRRKESRFEHIICQLDRNTGEVVIPQRSRGLVRALKMQAEHRFMGWMVAGFFSVAFLISCLHESTGPRQPFTFTTSASDTRTTTRPADHARRALAHSAPNSAASTETIVAHSVPMVNVQVGSRLTSYMDATGVLVLRGVPEYESRPVAPSTGRSIATPGNGKINLNSATVDVIDKALPGVGPVLAAAIVAGRPYKSIDDLRKVRRIGSRTYMVVAPLVSVN